MFSDSWFADVWTLSLAETTGVLSLLDPIVKGNDRRTCRTLSTSDEKVRGELSLKLRDLES